MKQTKKIRRKVISYVLALVMVFSTMTGIVPGTIITAQAAANNIIINSAEHGSVTANPASAESGTTVTLTAQPDKGYKLKNISASYKGIVPDSFSCQDYVYDYSGTQFNLYSNYPDVGWRVGYGTENKVSVTSKSDTSKIDRVVLKASVIKGTPYIQGTIKANVGTVTRNGNTITVSDINNTTVTIYSEDNAYPGGHGSFDLYF